ncbi:hypothetical protein C2G38_2147985 [Gigaspora rosea]|uniref:Peptidase S1 domain-containing protein n=1 Tax=Gigaspora rosea TaxID=44941 RepID=A0A397UHD5_9GLOM|nr:hypothetical protein C2G38_2147985 [Gigaspora rosea]
MKYTCITLNLLLLLLILQSLLIACDINDIIAQLLNVRVKEVPGLILQEKILINGSSQLTQLLDESTFCGSSIDIKANKIFINTIDMSKKGSITNNPAMKPYLNLLSFVQVKNSLAQLNFTFNEASKLADKYNATFDRISIECQVQVNNVVIYLNHAYDEKNAAFIKSIKELKPIPIISYIVDQKKEVTINPSINKPSMPVRVFQVFGGDGIYTISQTGCSAGFWVRLRGRELLVTAGHCGGLTEQIDPRRRDFYHLSWVDPAFNFKLIGSMIVHFVSPVDKGFIMRNNTNAHAVPFIRSGANDYLQISGVVSPLEVPRGSLICKSGYSTKVTCGFIDTIYGTLVHSDGVTHDRVIVIKYMLCAAFDSGGPVYAYDPNTFVTYLIGIVFGGQIENGTNFCLAHPVEAILIPGMEVMTINNTPNYETPVIY